MTSKARDVHYGRRGGGWVDHRPGQLLAELRLVLNRLRAAGTLAEPIDRSRLFRPEAIAAARAHDQQCHRAHKTGEQCTAQYDPADLAAVWAGRARMAAARRSAGVALDDVDREALRRAEVKS